jgi:hypothetical protein
VPLNLVLQRVPLPFVLLELAAILPTLGRVTKENHKMVAPILLQLGSTTPFAARVAMRALAQQHQLLLLLDQQQLLFLLLFPRQLFLLNFHATPLAPKVRVMRSTVVPMLLPICVCLENPEEGVPQFQINGQATPTSAAHVATSTLVRLLALLSLKVNVSLQLALQVFLTNARQVLISMAVRLMQITGVRTLVAQLVNSVLLQKQQQSKKRKIRRSFHFSIIKNTYLYQRACFFLIYYSEFRFFIFSYIFNLVVQKKS